MEGWEISVHSQRGCEERNRGATSKLCSIERQLERSLWQEKEVLPGFEPGLRESEW